MPRRKGSSEDFPPDIHSKLSTEELIKRLKAVYKYLSECVELLDSNAVTLNQLSSSLTASFLHNHRHKDVKALTAAALVEIFRLFHPNHPYDDEDIKVVFSLLVSQLKGLENPTGPSFKQAYQLLESVSKLQLFLLCASMDPPDILVDLFHVAFSVINEQQGSAVRGYLLDILVSLLQETEFLSQEILDSVLLNVVDPVKTDRKSLHSFVVQLIKKSSPYIEPIIRRFFNNMLVVGGSSESELGPKLYSLILELYAIDSSLLLFVLPQLEHKLKSVDEGERVEACRVLAKMFSAPYSKLAVENKPLWHCFLGRFQDVSTDVRRECLGYSKHFLLHHPHLAADITEKLHIRVLDKDSKVRVFVVKAVVDTAAVNMEAVPQQLADDVVERMRDKQWAVRREAMIGLSRAFDKLLTNKDREECLELIQRYAWIPNHLLHCYYKTSPDDQLCVERCLLGCMVPVILDAKARMTRLLQVYSVLDQPAARALDQILLSRRKMRQLVRELVDTVLEEGAEEESRDRAILSKISPIAKKLPNSVKAQSALLQLGRLLSGEGSLRELVLKVVDQSQSCQTTIKAKNELLAEVKDNDLLFNTLKDLVDSSYKVLLDRESVAYLLEQASESLAGLVLLESVASEEAARNMACKTVVLLKGVAGLIPGCVATPQAFSCLMDILNTEDPEIKRNALSILASVGGLLEVKVTSPLQSLLPTLVASGPPSLAKAAVHCLNSLFPTQRTMFEKLCSNLVGMTDYGEPGYLSALVGLGQLAKLQSEVFLLHSTALVKKLIKNLMLEDKEEGSFSSDDLSQWAQHEELSYETRAKVCCMKLLVNWMCGSEVEQTICTQVIKILVSLVNRGGDLQDQGHVSPGDRSWLRLDAAKGLLKLSTNKDYYDLITPDQFVTLAGIIQDPCQEVRKQFGDKLSGHLMQLTLPLGFLSMFVLAGSEPNKAQRSKFKNLMMGNVANRRRIFEELSRPQDKVLVFQPEYSISHALYLLSHHPGFSRTKPQVLDSFRDSLWFYLEPIIARGDNYSLVHKLLEMVKSAVDAANPDDPELNKNLYCAADLALGLLLKRISNARLGDDSQPISLPRKFFSFKKKNTAKNKGVKYLPPNYDCTPSKPATLSPSKPFHRIATPAKGLAKAVAPGKKGKAKMATSTPVEAQSRGRGRPSKRKRDSSDSEEDYIPNLSTIKRDGSRKNIPSTRKLAVRRKVLAEPVPSEEDPSPERPAPSEEDPSPERPAPSEEDPSPVRRSKRIRSTQAPKDLPVKKSKVREAPATKPTSIKRKAKHRRR